MLVQHAKSTLLFIAVPIIVVAFFSLILINQTPTTIPTGLAHASEISSDSSSIITQRKVAVDIYVINVGDVDQAAGTYSVDMYLSFTWNGTWSASSNNSTNNGNITSSSALPINFEFTNGYINNEHLICSFPNINGTGSNYLSYRILATLSDPFDFERYPLDKQTLSIDIEDSYYDNTTLVYISDNHSMFDPGVQVAGWVIQKNTERFSITDHVYNTSFGYPGASPDSQSTYSHVEFSVIIVRPLSTAILALAIPIIVLVALAMLTFQIPLVSSVDFDKRVDIGLISIFAAVGFLLAIGNGLPAGNFTLADKMMVLAFAVLLYSNILTVWFHKFDSKNQPKFVKKIDKISFISIPIIVASAIMLLIVL